MSRFCGVRGVNLFESDCFLLFGFLFVFFLLKIRTKEDGFVVPSDLEEKRVDTKVIKL